MVDVVREYVEHDLQLRLFDCLNKETLVMGHEEEATALARALAHLKYFTLIKFWRETVHEQIQAKLVTVIEFTKLVELVVGNRCLQRYFGVSSLTLRRDD